MTDPKDPFWNSLMKMYGAPARAHRTARVEGLGIGGVMMPCRGDWVWGLGWAGEE